MYCLTDSYGGAANAADVTLSQVSGDPQLGFNAGNGAVSVAAGHDRWHVYADSDHKIRHHARIATNDLHMPC